MAILETQNLTYKYSVGTPFEKVAIEDISISVEKGDFIGITLYLTARIFIQIRISQDRLALRSDFAFSTPNISFLKTPFMRILHSALKI